MSSQTVNGDFVTGSAVRYFSTPAVCYFSTPWQQKILSSYLKETPKQYTITEFLYLPYLVRYFDLQSLVVRHIGFL